MSNPLVQSREKSLRTGEGLGNPPFFVTRLQCVDPALDLVSCYKKARLSGGPGDGEYQYNDHGHHMQRLFVIKGGA